MEKFIPYEKLSEREKRKMNLAKRQTWGELNPVTRKPQNSKAYNRNKSRNWKRDYQRNQFRVFIFAPLSVIMVVRNGGMRHERIDIYGAVWA